MEKPFVTIYDRIFDFLMMELRTFLNGVMRDTCDLERFKKYLESIGIDPSQLQNPSGSGINPYFLLGLEKTATEEEVKNRYREMLRRFHPDTAGIAGTECICQQITDAYQQIAKERGWK